MQKLNHENMGVDDWGDQDDLALGGDPSVPEDVTIEGINPDKARMAWVKLENGSDDQMLKGRRYLYFCQRKDPDEKTGTLTYLISASPLGSDPAMTASVFDLMLFMDPDDQSFVVVQEGVDDAGGEAALRWPYVNSVLDAIVDAERVSSSVESGGGQVDEIVEKVGD